jgi:hypothetical protein
MKTLSQRSAGLLATSLLLAGVSTLLPASVRAVGNDTCSFGGNMAKPNCIGFSFTKQDDKQLKLLSLPSTGAGTIQFVEQTPNVWVVDVDFLQELMATASGTFEYEIEIDAANSSYFNQVGLAIIGPPLDDPMFNATKTVYGPTSVNPLASLFVDETDESNFDSFAGLVKKIRVVDKYEVTMGSLNSIQNSYSQKEAFPPTDRVPGPLPLLGAGAAFGFSRRLRTRVLTARGA